MLQVYKLQSKQYLIVQATWKQVEKRYQTIKTIVAKENNLNDLFTRLKLLKVEDDAAKVIIERLVTGVNKTVSIMHNNTIYMH